MTFFVSTKEDRDILQVEATSYSAAAQSAMEKLTKGRCRNHVVERTTGDHNKSGWFAVYRTTSDGLNSTGITFHLR